MKREFLKTTIPGITDEQITAIMAEAGKETEELKTAKEQLVAKDQQITGLNGQIEKLNSGIEDLRKTAGDKEAMEKQIEDMKTAHKQEVDKLNKQIADQAYDHATESFFASVKFKSAFARKAIIADFKSKGYKLQDGKFVGAEGYIDSVKKDDPAAFEDEKKDEKKEEKQEPENNGQPRFTRQMSNNQGAKNDPNPFDFHFMSVRGDTSQKK